MSPTSSSGVELEKEGEHEAEEQALASLLPPPPRAAEDARLTVMGKEREALAQMIGIGISASARR